MNYWIIILTVLLSSVSIAALNIMIERRFLALWQDRLGPNRIGPFGVFQVVADMIKIFTKEDWIPSFVNKPIFVLAPTIVMIAIMMSFAIVPFAPGFCVLNSNVGLLFFLGNSSLAVYSIVLGGWASNNKYSLIGGMRAASQMISYEVFMGLSLMGVVMIAGSFNLNTIVESQRTMWNVIPQFAGFVTFLIAGFAEAHRSPFDLPESDGELIAGFHTEYSSMKFGMFFVGEYLGITLVSAMIVSLFFGGWLGPAFLPPMFWFLAKTFVFILFFVLVRASLPRPRYDQLMEFGWKWILPITLINILITAAVLLVKN